MFSLRINKAIFTHFFMAEFKKPLIKYTVTLKPWPHSFQPIQMLFKIADLNLKVMKSLDLDTKICHDTIF